MCRSRSPEPRQARDDERVTIYAIHADWRGPDAVGEATLQRIVSTFRPNDEGVCIWVPEDQPGTLRLELDVDAADEQAALTMGRAAITEAALLGPLAGSAERVVAMTDEAMWEWIS